MAGSGDTSKNGSDYLRAFHTTRRFKSLMMLIVLLCLALQIGAYAAVGILGVVDPLFAQDQPSPEAAEKAGNIQFILLQAMPIAKTTAFASAALLSLGLMFAAKISLVDRLGGAAGLVGAFFWSLILLAMVTPWQDIVSSTYAWGAMTDYAGLTQAVGDVRPGWAWEPASKRAQVFHYTRMLGYPVAALLVLVITQLRFRRGYAGFGAAVAG